MRNTVCGIVISAAVATITLAQAMTTANVILTQRHQHVLNHNFDLDLLTERFCGDLQ
jgi:hypothetical protein